MLQFEKPIYKITDSIESNFYGRFELEPLERGFGTTIGNALRRVMLSSLPGSAISSIRIDGVLHEFQTIDGVYEDVTTIILNLKGVVFKNHSNEPKTVRINATKEGEVTAGDIEHDPDIEVINKDKVIAHDWLAGFIANEGKGMNYIEEPLFDYRLHNTNVFGGRSLSQNIAKWKQENGGGYESFLNYRKDAINRAYYCGIKMCKEYVNNKQDEMFIEMAEKYYENILQTKKINMNIKKYFKFARVKAEKC